MSVLERICELARSELEIDMPLCAETRLVEDLGLDSMQLLTLAVEVENQFRVCIEPEDEATIANLGDLARVVDRLLADSHFSEGDSSGENERIEDEAPSR